MIVRLLVGERLAALLAPTERGGGAR